MNKVNWPPILFKFTIGIVIYVAFMILINNTNILQMVKVEYIIGFFGFLFFLAGLKYMDWYNKGYGVPQILVLHANDIIFPSKVRKVEKDYLLARTFLVIGIGFSLILFLALKILLKI